VFEVQSSLMLLLSLVLFAVKAFALVDCVLRDAGRFSVADSLPKNTWLVILGLAVVAHAVFWAPLSLLNLAGTVAALVYLAQLRGSHV
jgi:hypothetical protein